MFISQHTVVIGACPSPLFPLNGLLASTVRIFSNTCVFTIVCSFRRPLVIRAFLAPSLHKNVFRACTVCALSKHLIFVIVCENAAFRRDWRSSDHLFEGLARQSGSRKLLLGPLRTTQRTLVIGVRPVPLLPPNGLLASKACTFSTTCVFAYVCSFRASVVIRVPAH